MPIINPPEIFEGSVVGVKTDNGPVFNGAVAGTSGYPNGNSVILTGGYAGLDPVRKSHFLVDVMGPGGATPPLDVQYLVKNFAIPERAVEVKSARFANHTKSYPGEHVKMPGVSLTLRCMSREPGNVTSNPTVGSASTAYQFFSAWFDLIYNRQDDSVGVVGEGPDSVSGNIYVRCLHVDGSTFAQAWLQFAWPSAIKVNDLDRDDDGNTLDFSVTFQCNDVEWSF